MSTFDIKLCGNPSYISLILNKMDSSNADREYPLHCLDGYHFEDATVNCSLDESNNISILSVTKGNIRGSL